MRMHIAIAMQIDHIKFNNFSVGKQKALYLKNGAGDCS